jgi:hypothetical protein
MAYGGHTPQSPPVPWHEFEELDYLFLFEDLLKEYWAVLVADEDAEEIRRRRERLGEAAAEYAAHCSRVHLERGV